MTLGPAHAPTPVPGGLPLLHSRGLEEAVGAGVDGKPGGEDHCSHSGRLSFMQENVQEVCIRALSNQWNVFIWCRIYIYIYIYIYISRPSFRDEQ